MSHLGMREPVVILRYLSLTTERSVSDGGSCNNLRASGAPSDTVSFEQNSSRSLSSRVCDLRNHRLLVKFEVPGMTSHQCRRLYIRLESRWLSTNIQAAITPMSVSCWLIIICRRLCSWMRLLMTYLPR